MQLKDLGKVSTTIKELKNVSDFTQVAKSVKDFTNENKLAALAVTALSDQQKIHILISQGMTTEEAKAAVAAQALAVSEGGAAIATDRLSLAFIGLGESLKKLAIAHPILTAVLAIGTAVGATCIAIDAFTESTEEAKEKLVEFQNEFTEASKEIESITGELESVRKNIEDINSLDGAQVTREGELKTLKEQEASLERQLIIEKERQALAKQNATEKAEKVLSSNGYEKIGDNTTDFGRVNDGSGFNGIENISYGTPVELLREATAEILEQQEAYDNLLAKKEELVKQGYTDKDQIYLDVLEEIEKTKQLRNQAREVAEEFNTSILDTIAGTNQESEVVKKAQAESDAYADALGKVSDEQDRVSKSGADTKSSLPSFDELTINADEYSKSVSSIVSSVKQLNDAFEEQNEYGNLSIDTINSLIENGYAAALSYDEQTGACKLSAEALNNLVAIKIQNQITDLDTLKNNIADRLKEEGVAALNTAADYAVLAKTKTDALSGNAQEWLDADAQIKNLQNLRNKILNGDYSTGKSSGSSSSAKKAETDYTKLLKNETDLLEKQLDSQLIDFKTYVAKRLSILKDYYDKGKISASEYYSQIGDTYDSQLSVYDKVINSVTNSIDRKIKSLEKEKSAVEENYKSQISTLESEKEKIEEANKAKEQSISLQKAQYELNRAEQQRSKSVLTKEGVIYTNDSSEVAEKRNNRDDITYEMQIDEIDAKIASLNDAMEVATSSIDNQIDALNSYRDKWEEISDTYEEQQEELLAAEILGSDYEKDVCNMRLDTLTTFTNQYIDLMNKQKQAALEAANAQSQVDKSTTSNNSNNNGGKKYDILSSGYATSGEAAQNISRYGGNDILKTGKTFSIIKKYSNGGLLGDKIAKSIGEDHLATIAYQEGERILSPIQNEMWEKWTNAMPDLMQYVQPLKDINIPDYSNLVTNNNNQPITVTVGDINIARCDNPDSLGNAIVNQLPNIVAQKLAQRRK